MQVALIDDVVSAEHAGGPMAANHHSDLLRDASPYQIPDPGSAQAVKQPSNAGGFRGVDPTLADN
jgi:hypothetical protein